MDKIAIQVEGTFFSELAAEAASMDRSPSWLLSETLRTWLPSITKIEARSVATADGERRTFWIPRDLHANCIKMAAKMGVASDVVVGTAWAQRAARS